MSRKWMYILRAVVLPALLLGFFIPVTAFGAKTLKAPQMLSADWVSGNQLSVRWSVVKGADGYVVYQKKLGESEYKQLAVQKGVENVRLICKNGKRTRSFFVVRAYTVKNGKTTLGPISNAKVNVTYYYSKLGEIFPKGVPTSAGAMSKYLETIRVPIWTGSRSSTMTLTVHKDLAGKIKGCFRDMKAMHFPVKPSSTGAYNWRRMTSINMQSHHSYGCVVDLNWDDNPYVKLSQIKNCSYKPGKNAYSITEEVVQIWKSYGFSWGGDWPEKKDYMHFTYTNN